MVKSIITISLFCILDISCSFLRKTTDNNYIETTLILDIDKLYFPIQIGEPSQHFRLLFDISSFHTWLGNSTLHITLPKIFNISQSTSLEQTSNTNVIATNQKGNEVLDIIKINSENPVTTEKKFHFILLNKLETITSAEGIIGMSRNYIGRLRYTNNRSVDANPRFSLLEYLHINKAISSKIFSIKFIAKDRAKLYLGTSGIDDKKDIPLCLPNEIEKDRGFYNNWNCPYYGVSMTNGTYFYQFKDDELKTVQFDTSIDYLDLNEGFAFMIFIRLQKLLKVRCNTHLIRGKGKTMFCPVTMDLSKVPDIIINLKGFDLKIPSKEIFEYYYSNSTQNFGYLCTIYGNNYNIGVLRLGISIMKYYHLVFNSEDGSVGFGEFIDIFEGPNKNLTLNNPIIKNRRRKWSKLEIFGIVLLIGIILFVGIYLIRRKFVMMKKIFNTKERLIQPVGQPMISKQ